MIYFVPARKDSKRIPNKNTLKVLGKPLIQYTLDLVSEMSKDKSYSGPVYVSTDDEVIIQIAKSYGFNWYKRDEELCSDRAKMSDVLFDAVNLFELEEKDICVLYPTGPLRLADHVREACIVWKQKQNPVSTLMSVCPVLYRPYGLMEIQANGFLHCKHPYGELFYQGQNQPVDYRANGAIYIIPKQVILKREINSQLFNKTTIPYVMDPISSLEIDTPEDILIAEHYLSKKNTAKFIYSPTVTNPKDSYAFSSH